MDFAIINTFAFLILSEMASTIYFIIFISLSWIIIALNIGFYEVYRFTKVIAIGNQILKQFALFTIFCFAFFGIYSNDSNAKEILLYTTASILVVGSLKIFIYYFLRKYRNVSGANIRKVVLLGSANRLDPLNSFFVNNPDYGYQVVQTFFTELDKKAAIEACVFFVNKEEVDEMYCSLFDLNDSQVSNMVEFADENSKVLKFIPETKDLFTRNLKVDYYGYIPVVSLHKTVLHDPITKLFKRIFDIFFSLIVIVFLLSWLTPLLALLIKLESKGPIFFKQGRPGIDEKEFFCYKFRSMKINKTTEKEASKNDPRVTNIGRFIRKTSLDEMPQFINVLLGEMSVVGPRPHLWSQNRAYGNRIKKYMFRHYVKPGITGLAQVRGYRGEIETDKDMVNRIKYDVYYIENWSIILDLKIIIQTVINIFKGEEKAY
ncbi:exopolysaccharide biosynthesis polyprenyl glycosylphosphotransferase [Flavobacterium antarcticum]|uniref:exopolysaccharide biosynthesis polyprenyl glycosylphosphotransferase n=1 Tax=Flavobacterium antarcticum TaxID=271155 RepID=UPI001FE1F149|nr:exopolysaccharide biosynthesis polyprenyl glycosylphosphotransferase [Flavobacterium antarcticum]